MASGTFYSTNESSYARQNHQEHQNSSSNSWTDKYLSCALCIWEVTKQKVNKFCCCNMNSDSTSRRFQWILLKQNLSITIAYYLIYFAFGMCVGFLGPTLEDLACYTGEPVKHVSWAFNAQTCFMVIGIILAGLVSKWLTADFLLLISLALLPVCLVIISFSQWLPLLAVTMAVMGLAMGAIDCLANLQLVNLYDKAVAPFLQAMYLFYGIGAVISPLIANNYTLNVDCSGMLLGSTVINTTDLDGDKTSMVVTTVLPVNKTLIQEIQRHTRVYEAFWIMAGIQIPLVLYMTIIVARQGFRVRNVNKNFKRLVNNEKKPILEELSLKDKKKIEKEMTTSQWQQYLNEFQGAYSISLSKAILLTVAACLIVFIYDGLQGHINEYLDTFAVKTIKSHHKKPYNYELLNVYFWSCYSVGRLISVGLALKFTPYFMLLLNIFGSQAAVLIFMGSLKNNYTCAVTGSILLGLFMSSVTPTTITMTEHFMDMTNIQMSVILGGAALGEMLMPLIEGQLIDDKPGSFVVLMLIAVTASWFVYAIFWFLGKATDKYKARKARAIASPSFIWYQQSSDYGIPQSETSFSHSSDSPSGDNSTKEGASEAHRRQTYTENSPSNEDLNLDEQPAYNLDDNDDLSPQKSQYYKY